MPAATVVPDAFDDPGRGNSSTYGVPDKTKREDLDAEIHSLTPNVRPLATMLMHPSLKTGKAKGPLKEWLEDDILPRIVLAALGSTTGSDTATSIAVAAGYGSYFRKGDLVRNEATADLMLVTGVSTDTLTVTRGIGAGGTGVVFSTTTDTLVRVSNASRQGDADIEVRMTVPARNYNYVQIFRYDWSVTWTAQKSQSQPDGLSDRFEYHGAQKQKELKRDLEQSLWVGKRDILTPSNQHPRGVMGGILSFISTNVKTITNSTNIAMADIETNLRAISQYSDDGDVVGFAAPFAMSAFNSFPLGTLSPTDPDIKKYGVQIRRWQGGGLEVPLVVKKDWDQLPKASPSLGGAIVWVNMSKVRLHWFRELAFHDNQQDNDEHIRKGEWHCECTLQVANEQSHGLIRNITQYA